MGDEEAAVFRRRIFYIHGFDPRGPSPYHRFFTENAEQAGKRWDRSISVSKREKRSAEAIGWTIEAQLADGRRTVTDYEVLRWDDTVRTLWSARKPLTLVVNAFLVLFDYARSGFLGDLYKPARASFFSVLTPPLAVTLLVLIWFVLVAFGSQLGGSVAAAIGLPSVIGAFVAVAIGLFGVWFVWKSFSSKTELWWLTRCLDYLRETAHGRATRSEGRSSVFAERLIQAARRQGTDEIVVCGHSLGALHAVRMVTLALSQNTQLGNGGPKVRVIFLGQSIPGYVAYGQDDDFRDRMIHLCTSERISVFDVTSGSDTGSTCRLDLLHRIDAEGARHKQERPPFHQVLSPETFRAVRSNPRAYHFQYLLPTERGEGFDYFELVTRPGPIETTRPMV
ncbi:MAG: hypothetical protein AAF830_06045 [Pseudomonadota bacterium]